MRMSDWRSELFSSDLTLIRKAFSTSVREAGDLSAGIFNNDGLMLAQAVTGTPGHVNAMAEAVRHFIDDIGPDNIFEEDVYITNDPWKATGTLQAITRVPTSFRHSKLMGHSPCTAMDAALGESVSVPNGRWNFEEALFFPVMKYADGNRRGVVWGKGV